MRLFWVSSAAVLALALGLAVQGQRSALRGGSPQAVVAKAQAEFLSQYRPDFAFDLAAAPQARFTELMSPESSLPDSVHYDAQALAALYRYSEDCGHAPPERAFRGDLKKAWVWQRYLCGDLARLPDPFFERPPYLHPSGESFVHAAERSGRPEFRAAGWRKTMSPYVHLLEDYPSLSREPLRALLDGSPIVLERERVFFRAKPTNRAEDGAKYLSYPLVLWTNHLAAYGLEATRWSADQWCVSREGDVCWRERASRFDWKAWLPALLIAALVGLVLFLGWLALQRWLGRRREREARQFALQTLTHELRTPAATLTVSLENLRRHFDSFPESAQEEYLRLCDGVQKLGRVIQGSTQYLKSDPSHVQLDPAAVDSLNALFESMLEPYGDRLTFVPLARDRKAKLDRFWVGLCVKNLVDNALTHGRPPVEVRLQEAGARLSVVVSDAGSVSHHQLDDLMAGLSRRGSSPGLGIGLSIVSRMARAMNGKLSLSPSPTTFSLTLGGLE